MKTIREYGMTKAELVRHTKRLYEEAYKADPVRTAENTVAVVGHEVFAWDSLGVTELTALRRAIYPTVLEARG